MPLDTISEAIAHFIGLFSIASEEARVRDDYLEFKALKAAAETPQDHEPTPLIFNDTYNFDDPTPGIHYVPDAPNLHTVRVGTYVDYRPIQIPVSDHVEGIIYPPTVIAPLYEEQVADYRLSDPSHPGQVASIDGQVNRMTDDDFLNVGTRAATFHTIGAPAIVLDSLMHEASDFQPLQGAQLPSTPDDIATFLTNAARALDGFTANLQAAAALGSPNDGSTDSHDGVTVKATTHVVGTPLEDGSTYVDGQDGTVPPLLADHLPASSPLAALITGTASATDSTDSSGIGSGTFGPANASTAANGETVNGEGSFVYHPTFTAVLGSNALINQASVSNTMLEGNVFAVAGNHFTLNAIIQTNAWSDSDSIGKMLDGWTTPANSQTEAYNLASFERIAVPHEAANLDHGEPIFPFAWSVTTIHGDFIAMNWVQQLNFITDNDSTIFSSSGGQTMVGTGGNLAVNSMSLADLGKYYDLVLVGGNFYDANMISQTNVLLDDDVVGALPGFQTSGTASLSTGGNLLWNQAKITNIGSNVDLPLNSAYAKTLENFQSGNHELSSGIFKDSAFSGDAAIRVLYISGNLYDVQSISQTNILGDSDQVALAMQSAAAGAQADWSISTGSNALVNQAQITDVNPASKTYFGGDHYSDELLVQTDIIRTNDILETKNADHLVNEAVAFLSDDMVQSGTHDPVSSLKDAGSLQPGHHDILQTILS